MRLNYKLVVLMVAPIFLVILGLSINLYQAIFIGTLIFGILLVCVALARLHRGDLEVYYKMPEAVWEAQKFAAEIILINRHKLPKFNLEIGIKLPKWIKISDAIFVPVLMPWERKHVSLQLEAQKRGIYSIGPLRASISDPLGVFYITQELTADNPDKKIQKLIVYPSYVALNKLPIKERSIGKNIYAAAADKRGIGLDFYGVREWQRGEDLKHIHWRATAKQNKLILVEHQEEELSGRVCIILDLQYNFGEGKETTLEYSIKLATSFIIKSLNEGRVVEILSCQDSSIHKLQIYNQVDLYKALEFLASLEATAEFTLKELLENYYLPNKGALTFIITAYLDHKLLQILLNFKHINLIFLNPKSFVSNYQDLPPQVQDILKKLRSCYNLRTYIINRGVDLRQQLSG